MMYPRLRDLREDSDMTQAALAKLLGMSQTGYSKYETGENDVPTQILIKLADLYGTSDTGSRIVRSDEFVQRL